MTDTATTTAVATRIYDLRFNRVYTLPPPPEPPELPPVGPPVAGSPGLVPVEWDGLGLMLNEPPTDGSDWFTAVVTNVDGWYGSPPLDGNDTARALSDGAVYGPKLLGARVVVITGAAVGPRAELMEWRDLLASRAIDRVPRELIIGDLDLGTSLTAMVRADTDSFKHTFFAGRRAFRYEVTVTAADPLLYDRTWQQVILSTATAADAGRAYDPPPQWPRRYDHPPSGAASGWGYGSPYPPGSAGYLTNAGNADAPVYATYDGDLTASTLTDGVSSLLLAAVGAGVQILVATATLTAEAPGGAARAAYVLPGSRPLVIPKRSTVRWHLYAQGSGTVTLRWRSAWA